MAIDYCVDYECEAKQVLGTGALLDLVQARVAYDAARQGAPGRSEHDFWTRVVRGPEKDRVEVVTVGHLRRRSNRLIEFTSECETCPANVRGGPAGCFGRITYPIDAQAERFLAAGAAALSQPAAPRPARTFVEWIEDGPVDGARVRRMREAARKGIRFFELSQPVPVAAPPVAVAGGGSAPVETSTLTTDQLIELMFFAFPNRSSGFHFAVPQEALSSHRAFLDFILGELDLGHRREALERSTTLEQLRLYARALAIAEELEVDLLVD
jgi:hypothetical protein